ncbi:ThiF family adenylyltransferase [Streptomyces sp. enrichment culture]|uniref:ThiF family adenylyltransferase n=1 Tax=Streptomyces sp. enrichment culture TaxID=1795815 RepID=UPI003F555E77
MPYPPLVQPSAELSDDEVRRYAHQLILAGHGAPGQRRLAAGRVLVIGADEIGAPLIAHLADSGVGFIGICDGSPLNPWDRCLGMPDTEPSDRASAWAATLRRTHPSVRTAVEGRFDVTSARDLVDGYDLVVCAGEDQARCQLADDVCAAAGVPLVWGSMEATGGRACVFWDRHGPGFRDLFPEPPTPYFRGMAGTLKVVGAWLAVTLATEVVKLLTGAGEPLVGRVVKYDAMAATCVTVPLRPDPRARRPAELTAAEPFFGLLSPAAAEAARESTVSAEELKDLLDRGEPVTLVDVREPDEYAFAHLPGSVLVPQGEFLRGDAADRLPRDRRTVLLCRAGVRSAEVLAVVKKSGHPDAVHLGGGILAWAERIDTAMPTY